MELTIWQKQMLIHIFKHGSINQIRDILIDNNIFDESFPHFYEDIRNKTFGGSKYTIKKNENKKNL